MDTVYRRILKRLGGLSTVSDKKPKSTPLKDLVSEDAAHELFRLTELLTILDTENDKPRHRKLAES